MPVVTPQPRAVLRPCRQHGGESCGVPPAPPSPASTLPLLLPCLAAAKALPTIPCHACQGNWFKSHIPNPAGCPWAQRSDPSAPHRRDKRRESKIPPRCRTGDGACAPPTNHHRNKFQEELGKNNDAGLPLLTGLEFPPKRYRQRSFCPRGATVCGGSCRPSRGETTGWRNPCLRQAETARLGAGCEGRPPCDGFRGQKEPE